MVDNVSARTRYTRPTAKNGSWRRHPRGERIRAAHRLTKRARAMHGSDKLWCYRSTFALYMRELKTADHVAMFEGALQAYEAPPPTFEASAVMLVSAALSLVIDALVYLLCSRQIELPLEVPRPPEVEPQAEDKPRLVCTSRPMLDWMFEDEDEDENPVDEYDLTSLHRGPRYVACTVGRYGRTLHAVEVIGADRVREMPACEMWNTDAPQVLEGRPLDDVECVKCRRRLRELGEL